MSDPLYDADLIKFLQSFVTEARREKIERVLAARTDRVRVVVEDLYQPHNASAVMRSCECFGVQNMHIIENRNTFAPNNEISLGSAQWLSLHRHREKDADNTRQCLTDLKKQGFTIVATALREDSIELDDVPTDQPVALLFGTEAEGLSETALELADKTMRIPMFGFTQSFNISVSAAICLSSLVNRVRKERDDWALDEATLQRLRSDWIRKSLKTPEALIRRYEEDNA